MIPEGGWVSSLLEEVNFLLQHIFVCIYYQNDNKILYLNSLKASIAKIIHYKLFTLLSMFHIYYLRIKKKR